MAFYSDVNTASGKESGKPGLFMRFVDFLARIGECNAKVAEIQRLQDKTDGQLAEMGLSRKDIVPHVMGASYYV